MCANTIFKSLGLSNEQITKLNNTLYKFKCANKDTSMTEEDLLMDIVVAYYSSSHIKNIVHYGASIGYHKLVKQWRRKYSLPVNFDYLPDSSCYSFSIPLNLYHMIQSAQMCKDIEALNYVIGVHSLVKTQSKVTKTAIRNYLNITKYEQEKIIKRIKNYYG